MNVYKFGGASVKDADSIKNVVNVLRTSGYNNAVIVVSAMGNTTNELEEIVNSYFVNNNYSDCIEKIRKNHFEILSQLFDYKENIFTIINKYFSDLYTFLKKNKSKNYNFIYDQIVSFGELISSQIVSNYLNKSGIINTWIDIRDYIKTDNTYREGKVIWKLTEKNFENFDTSKVYVTQGFLAADDNYFSVTLGREGSDYSAAIIAYCLQAENMIIWKDVPGVMNADPKYFKEAQLLKFISYEETIELSFYGASVIHPKTIQPLQQKEIPLNVRSFIYPEKNGTIIKKGATIDPLIPCFILKKDIHLLTISSRDFSFMQEKNLSYIFNKLSVLNIKVTMLNIAAVSISLCVEDKYNNLSKLIEELEIFFKLNIIKNVSLYTIRHSNAEIQQKLTSNKNVLLEQLVKDTYQVVINDSL